jgi:hypothetical protein
LFFKTGYAQSQDPTPVALKSFESKLQGACMKLKDDYPELQAMKAAEAASICSCAIPFTSDSVVLNRITSGDRVYVLLSENYFKCGEARIKEYWLVHLQSKNKKLNRSQAICIADHQYKMFLSYFESRAITNLEELNRQTAHCF